MPRSVIACLECLERCQQVFYDLGACFTLFKSAYCLKGSVLIFSVEVFFMEYRKGESLSAN